MGQAQINVRTRACSRTSIARTKQAALTHNVRGKELKRRLITCNRSVDPYHLNRDQLLFIAVERSRFHKTKFGH